MQNALYTHPAVAEVAVIATPHERCIEAVTAVVALRPGATVDEAELIAHARGPHRRVQTAEAGALRRRTTRNQSRKLLKRVLRDQIG